MNEKPDKIVFLFSGQGSHYRKMGQKLFENNIVFRKSIEQSEAIIQECSNISLVEELYFENNPNFDNLQITHSAIVAVEIAMLNVLKSMDIVPDFITGSSLGQFAAGVAAGIWTDEIAIRASILQAKSILENGIRGGLLAVIDQQNIVPEKDYEVYNLFVASKNFEGHCTLSGLSENLDLYQSKLSEKNISFVRLPVNVPFHSPLILDGLVNFNNYVKSQIILQNPKPGFISGVKCREIDTIDTKYFGEVVSCYIDYPKLVNYIENRGSCLYIDLGPSGTEATFVKYNLDRLSRSNIFQIMTPFKRELDQLELLKITLNNMIDKDV